MTSTTRNSLTRWGQTALQNVTHAGAHQNVGQAERQLSAVAGGGLILFGLLRGKLSGLLAALGGGALLYRSLTGHCHVYGAMGVSTADPRGPATAVPAHEGYKIEKILMIYRSPEELYRFWSNFENLPQIMKHLKSVTPVGENRWRWVAQGPLGSTVEWDAEVYGQREGEMIAWRSLPGAQVDTAGSVHFEPGPTGRGTRMRVSLKYNPPAGKVGAVISSILGADVDTQVEQDLQRFKQVMEAGEALTTEGQPSGQGISCDSPTQPFPGGV